jgi:hypothetical protein
MIREKFGDGIIKWVLKSNQDGWVLVQDGQQYRLEPLEEADQSDVYQLDDGETMIEDRLDMMHLFGTVPLGLRLESRRPVVDIQSASAAAGEEKKLADGGELTTESTLSVKEIENRLKVGSVRTQQGVADIINPFHLREDEPDIVDLRPTVRLFENAADPETPVRAAKNAVEAERAVQGMDWGNAAQIGGMITAFLMGAITVEYIAGGSSGGGVNVGLMLDIATAVMAVMPL